MNILVTGSDGGIGKHLVQTLLQAGHTLRTFDIHARRPSPDCEHIPGDIRDLPTVRRAVQGMDAVCHLGAIPYDFYDEEVVLTTNVQGTWNVLLACREAGVGRLVSYSSIQALGRAGKNPLLSLPMGDDQPHHALPAYGLSKHLGEEMCKSFASDALKIISLRPTLVTFWQGGYFDFYQKWRELKDEASDLEKHQFDLWSYVDVDDVCQANLLSLTAQVGPFHAFLLAAEDTMMTTPTAELVQRKYPQVPWKGTTMETYLAKKPHRSLIDCSHARQVLGWQPQFSWRNL